MNPEFSAQAGEHLVATHIEESHWHLLNVSLPSKDMGVDLLVTDKGHRRTLSVNVKFSRDFLGTSKAVVANLRAQEWWAFDRKKLNSSPADLWVLVLCTFTQGGYDFMLIEPRELSKRCRMLGRRKQTIQSYAWVTSGKRCRETRGLSREPWDGLAHDDLEDPIWVLPE